MSKLMTAAGRLIEHGRSLQELDRTRVLVEQFTRAAADARNKGRGDLAAELERFAHDYAKPLPEFERHAITAKQEAEELMSELEHPGAVLGRRLIAAWLGARAAWRGTR